MQKHTIDERLVAEQFGERLIFLVGFDVQQILASGRPEEVRAEMRHLIDTFDRPGSGILRGAPLENIDAFLDEALRYGKGKRARTQANKQLRG